MTLTDGPRYERTEVVETPSTTLFEPPVDSRVVVPVAPVPVSGGEVHKAYASRIAPDAVIAALAGLVILVVGLIAIIRGGFAGSISDPVVTVVGFTHTTLLGLIEIGIGLALLISGATSSRAAELFFSCMLGVGGFVGAVQTSSFKKSLALESSMAWVLWRSRRSWLFRLSCCPVLPGSRPPSPRSELLRLIFASSRATCGHVSRLAYFFLPSWGLLRRSSLPQTPDAHSAAGGIGHDVVHQMPHDAESATGCPLGAGNRPVVGLKNVASRCRAGASDNLDIPPQRVGGVDRDQ